MALLLIFTQEEKNLSFFLFAGITCFTGICVEIAGVNTNILFGDYHYTSILGAGSYGVPFIIGVNWFIVIYCCGCVTFNFEEWLLKRFIPDGTHFSSLLQIFSFAIDAALLTVFFDWVLEPAAIKLNLWEWEGDKIPLYNYVCWFFISTGLMVLFRKLNFKKDNIFALHLLIIQILFFLSIEIFL